MKKINLNALLALAGTMLAVQSAQADTVTVTQTDWILGFRATSGTGSALSLEVDLGPAVNFYGAAAGSSFTLPRLLLTDLTSTYGSAWNSRTDLFFGVIGTTGVGGLGGAKPDRTIWASRPWSAPNLTGGQLQTTPYNSPPSAVAANIPVNKINSMTGTTGSPIASGSLNGATSTTAGGSAAVINATLANSYKSQDGASNSFGFFQPTIDQVSNIPAGGYVGMDMFETGINGAPANYIGSITINDQGVGTFTAVPEPSTYALLGLGLLGLCFVRRFKNITT